MLARRTHRLALLGALLGWAGPAAARDCRQAIAENQRHARAIEHDLRHLEALAAHIERMQTFNTRVFVDLDDPLRITAMTAFGARFVTLGGQCTAPAPYDLSANGSPLALSGSVVWTPHDLRLDVFGLGRSDALLLQPPSPTERESVAQYRGLLGARLHLTRWLALGLARVATARDDADDPALAGAVDGPDDPRWVFEVGAPRFGSSLRFTADGERLAFSKLAVRELPLTDALRFGFEWDAISTEDRHVFTPRVRYALTTADGTTRPGLDTWAEVAIETGDLGLRHGRLGVRAPMLTTRVRRGDYNPFGVHIEQRGALSVHRGAALRAASGVEAAFGAQYDVLVELRTPFITFGFDFGLGFNAPEALDLYPGLADSLSLAVGIRLGNHW